MASIEQDVEMGAGVTKGGQITEIPPLTFKEVLRHPVDFLIAGIATVFILGTAWMEYQSNGSSRKRHTSRKLFISCQL